MPTKKISIFLSSALVVALASKPLKLRGLEGEQPLVSLLHLVIILDVIGEVRVTIYV